MGPRQRKVSEHHVVEEDEEFVFRKKRKLTQEDAPEGEGTSLIPPAPAPAAAGVPAAPDAKQQEASALTEADVDPSVPEFLRPILLKLPANGTPQERLVALVELLGHRVLESLEFHKDFLPEDMDYEELRSAYADVLGRWGQRVREAVARNELLFPGDVEAGGDPGYLDEEARAAMLRALRDKLAREEKEWASLADQSRDSAARVAEAQGTVDEHQRAAVAAAKKEVQASSKAGELSKAYAEAHRRSALQVDSLSAVVSGVEELVRQAESACDLLQAQLVDVKFRAFAHINSPEELIRHLSRR